MKTITLDNIYKIMQSFGKCYAIINEKWEKVLFPNIYFRYRDYRFDPIEGNGAFDSSVFSSSEKAILDSVIKNICCYSGKVLEKLTHSEAPWLSARGELPTTTASDRTIQKKQIGDYFSAVKEKYNMINPNDIKGYTQNMFEQM